MIRLRLLGYKGYFVLSNIIKYSEYISDVVIGRDKNVQNDYYKEIKQLCIENRISFHDRTKEPKCEATYSVSIGWRWLSYDNNASIIVFHDSLLPKYRGFNPLVTALINGDEFIGVTCLLGSEEYDTGDIIAQQKIRIEYPTKIKTVIENISPLYLELMILFLEKIKNRKPIETKRQDECLATYSLWRDESDYFIDWEWSSEKIKRHIDAVGYPYTWAKTKLNNQVLIIKDASVVKDVNIENRVVGRVLFKNKNGLTIVCGEGLLLIKNFYTIDNDYYDYQNQFRLKFHK